MYQQFQQNSALSAQPSNQPRVSLNICAEESSEPVSWSVRGNILISERIESEYLISVDASDLGIYYLDEKVFVTKLCETNRTPFLYILYVDAVLQIPVVVL